MLSRWKRFLNALYELLQEDVEPAGRTAAQRQQDFYENLAEECRDIQLSAEETKALATQIMRGDKKGALKLLEEKVERKAFNTILRFERLVREQKADYLMLWNTLEGRALHAKSGESSETARIKILSRLLASFTALQEAKIDELAKEASGLNRAGKQDEATNLARDIDDIEMKLEEKIKIVGQLNTLKDCRALATSAAMKVRNPAAFVPFGR